MFLRGYVQVLNPVPVKVAVSANSVVLDVIPINEPT